jgi:dethiobiotin synthetase
VIDPLIQSDERVVLFITGAKTGIGKTIATGAIPAFPRAAGQRVAVARLAHTDLVSWRHSRQALKALLFQKCLQNTGYEALPNHLTRSTMVAIT